MRGGVGLVQRLGRQQSHTATANGQTVRSASAWIAVILTVLRIRDVDTGSDFFLSQFPDPGSELSPSRIPDPNCLHPGSRIRIKEFKYFNPQKTKKMVTKL